MVRYQLRATNRGKMLAGLWNLLEPICLALAWYLVLVKVFQVRTESFIVILFLSVSLHRFIIMSLNRGASCLSQAKSMIMSGALPTKKVVLYAALLEAAITLAFSLTVFFGMAIIGRYLTFGTQWLSLLLLVPLLMLFALCNFQLLSVVGVYWRDLQNAMTVLSRVLFFCSPVLYQVTRIPERYRWIYMLNPLACFYNMFRRVLLFGEWPNGVYLSYVAGFVAVHYLISHAVFKRLEGKVGKYW